MKRSSMRIQHAKKNKILKKINDAPIISNKIIQFPFLLSKFPTSVVLHTLFYLKTTEQIQLGVLSKTWLKTIKENPLLIHTIDGFHENAVKKLYLLELVKLIKFSGTRLKNLYVADIYQNNLKMDDQSQYWVSLIFREIRSIMIKSGMRWNLDRLAIYVPYPGRIFDLLESNKIQVNKIVHIINSRLCFYHLPYGKKIMDALGYNISEICTVCNKKDVQGRKCSSCNYFECFNTPCTYNFAGTTLEKTKIDTCSKCFKIACEKCDKMDFVYQTKTLKCCTSCK